MKDTGAPWSKAYLLREWAKDFNGDGKRHSWLVGAADLIERQARTIARLTAIGNDLCKWGELECDCDTETCPACVDVRRWRKATKAVR